MHTTSGNGHRSNGHHQSTRGAVPETKGVEPETKGVEPETKDVEPETPPAAAPVRAATGIEKQPAEASPPTVLSPQARNALLRAPAGFAAHAEPLFAFYDAQPAELGTSIDTAAARAELKAWDQSVKEEADLAARLQAVKDKRLRQSAAVYAAMQEIQRKARGSKKLAGAQAVVEFRRFVAKNRGKGKNKTKRDTPPNDGSAK